MKNGIEQRPADDIKIPKTYLDRERSGEKKNDKYVFISYSHNEKDKKFVYSDLLKLFDLGVYYWYDVENNIGENWDENVRKYLEDDDCVGVIFYLSEYAFQSAPIEKEMRFYREKREKAEKHGGCNMFYFSVNIGGGTTNNMLRRTYRLLDKHSNKELERNLPLERIRLIAEMFSSNKLYGSINDDEDDQSESAENRISSMIRKMREYGVVSDTNSFIDGLRKAGMLGGNGRDHTIRLGKYPQNVCGPDAVDFENREDGRYSLDDLEWIILNASDDDILLVTKDCIDRVEKKKVREWLETFRNKLDLDENIVIEPPRLLRSDEFERYLRPTSYCLTKATPFAGTETESCNWSIEVDGKIRHVEDDTIYLQKVGAESSLEMRPAMVISRTKLETLLQTVR